MFRSAYSAENPTSLTPNQFQRMICDTVKRYQDIFENDGCYLGTLPGQLELRDLELHCRRNFKGHITASALLFNSKRDSVLLLHHKVLNRWLQPGGHLEGLEMPEESAFRELVEESGIESASLLNWHHTSKVPIDIDSHFIPNNDLKAEPEHYHHDFLYVFGLLDDVAVRLQEEEVSGFQWFEFGLAKSGGVGQRMARALAKLDLLGLRSSV